MNSIIFLVEGETEGFVFIFSLSPQRGREVRREGVGCNF